MKIISYIIIFLFIGIQIFSQRIPIDSTQFDNKLKKDTVIKAKKKSSLDTVVVYSANDTVSFDLQSGKMRLRGESQIQMSSQTLNAEIIEISIEESLLFAKGVEDTNGVIKGYPVFNDLGQEFAGKEIKYNFKTNKGNILLGETEMDQGFYYGGKIKRAGERSLYIKDGKYTTCEPPADDFYFGSPKMKIVVKDKIFLDPLIVYVKDMPVFIVPFGLFLPNKSGRQSGILIPSFYFSKARGVAFDDFGFYWAASNYWDTQLTTNIYTKGGYLLKNSTRWKLRDVFNGNMKLEYGKSRFSLDDNWTTNYSFQLNHNHSLSPSAKLDANLNFSSQDYNRNTSMQTAKRIQQTASSRASYSKSFENKSNLNLSYNRDQNIINETYDQSLKAAFSLPAYKPLENIKNIPDWIQDFQSRYSVNVSYYDDYKESINNINVNADSFYKDTNYVYSTKRRIEHRPSISISPKLGYFTVTPSFSFSANNYFRRLNRYMNADSTIVDEIENGLFTEYRYGLSLSLSTKLYGMFDNKNRLFGFIKPDYLGIIAARHTFQPSFSFNYTPDLSNKSYGFYDTYYDIARNEEVRYSRYSLDGGGLASTTLSKSLSYSDNHTFEIKVPQGDTLEPKNIELFKINFSSNYNFASDSLNLSDINMSFRSSALDFLDFNGNARFTPYDQVKILTFNPLSGRKDSIFRKINKFRLNQGKSLVRLTNFSLNLSTSYSPKGQTESFSDTREKRNNKDTSDTEESNLGKGFETGNQESEDLDFFGEYNPGYSSFNPPWSINFGLQYSYTQPDITFDTKSQRFFVNFSGNFKLTKSWNFTFNSGYDVLNKELRAPNINISKRIGCQWELSLQWTPIGINRGFYARFGIAVPQLQDLQLEKRNNPLLR